MHHKLRDCQGITIDRGEFEEDEGNNYTEFYVSKLMDAIITKIRHEGEDPNDIENYFHIKKIIMLQFD